MTVRFAARLALCSAFVAFGIPVLPNAAMAESQGTETQRTACMMDAFHFCLSAIPDHRRIEACLRANRRSISSACYHEIYDDAEVSAQRTAKPQAGSGSHAPE